MTPLTLSVVMPTQAHRWDLTLACLRTVATQLSPSDELLVVAPTELRLPDDLRGVRSVKSDHAGSAHQRNIGIDATRGDVILFLDDDISLAPRVVETLKSSFVQTLVDGATGRIEGTLIQSPLGRSWLQRAALAQPGPGRVSKSGVNELPSESAEVSEVEWLPGGLLALRRTSLGADRFDESLESGPVPGYALGEDLDLTLRLHRRGCRLLRLPTVEAVHHGEEDWKKGSFAYWEKKALVRRYLAGKPTLGLSRAAAAWSLAAEVGYRVMSVRRPADLASVGGLVKGSLEVNPLRRAKRSRVA